MDEPANGERAATNGNCQYMSLRVSGSGGGQWHLVTEHGDLVSAGLGLRNGNDPACYLTSNTFTSLVNGDLSCESAINSGKLIVAGSTAWEVARLFRGLVH